MTSFNNVEVRKFLKWNTINDIVMAKANILVEEIIKQIGTDKVQVEEVYRYKNGSMFRVHVLSAKIVDNEPEYKLEITELKDGDFYRFLHIITNDTYDLKAIEMKVEEFLTAENKEDGQKEKYANKY